MCKAWSSYSKLQRWNCTAEKHRFDVQHSFGSLSMSEPCSWMRDEAFRLFRVTARGRHTEHHGASEPSSVCFQEDLKVSVSFHFFNEASMSRL